MRNIGLNPVVDEDKAQSHSIWQHKLLLKSHSFSIIKRKKTRPLIYREAYLNGKERPLKIGPFNKYKVNNPWQSTVYQGLESIYLKNITEGLDIVKKIWEKGYYEGYPWDMDHWGMRGHIYMTHPGLWAILNSLTGVTYNAFDEKITFDPRKYDPNTEENFNIELPVFFPDFWLWISYHGENLTIIVEKSFKKGLFIRKLIYKNERNEHIVYNLDERIEILENNKMSLILD